MFYHGTSSLAPVGERLLPPKEHNFGINEDNRKIHSTRVFFSTNKEYALCYARRCCSRVGGEPVLFEVLPKNPKLLSKTKGCDVYYDTDALIYRKLQKNIRGEYK